MKYDIAFLSRLIPHTIEANVKHKMISYMEDADIPWQWNIIEGIEAANGGSVSIINFLPVNSYPNSYKEPYIHETLFSHTEGANDISLGHCNVRYVKRFAQLPPLRQAVKRWASNELKIPKVLIAFSMYPEFMDTLRWLKNKYPRIVTLNIVLDLPQYNVLSNRKKSILGRAYTQWSKKMAYERTQAVDGFVLITKQMAEEIAKEKPFTIIEGICTQQYPLGISKKKQILYAGTLHERFGIIHLLDAFMNIQDQEIKLVICGSGDSEEEIHRREKIDSRIRFLGSIPREEVLKAQMESAVIVNPRLNRGEYTKFSFPSKNMEALSSGIPFVAYKLDGIPDEYDKYINYPEDESIESLGYLLEKVCHDEDGIYMKLALDAKQWVRDTKNPKSQGKKITDLVDEILEKKREELQIWNQRQNMRKE